MTDRLLIHNVLVVEPGIARARRQDVFVQGGRIEALGEPSFTPIDREVTRVIEGGERLLTPGLVNAHTHSPLNILKGTGDVSSHPAFMWLNQADTAGRTPDEVRLSALLGCIEHLLNGTTAVIDHFPEQGFSDRGVRSWRCGFSMRTTATSSRRRGCRPRWRPPTHSALGPQMKVSR
jgi:cytosine/adenosine deaminase-related metal-dependent hydrolase